MKEDCIHLECSFCDCLKRTYCLDNSNCAFYQSKDEFKHGLPVENGAMIFRPVERIKPKPRKQKMKTIRDNSGLNYQFK